MANDPRDQLELLIASACRLIGENAGVGSVSVVGGRRLTAAELLRSQERALACGTRLTMDGAGVVTLRGRGGHAAGNGHQAPQPPQTSLFLPRTVLH